MAHTISEARIALDWCNRALIGLGSDKQIHMESGYGKRRLVLTGADGWCREVGAPGTPNEMYRALDAMSDVLEQLARDLS